MYELIGIIATIIFGILGIGVSYWLYTRKKRPCEILYLAIDCINVYNKLSLDFDSLKITTNDKRIENDLIFISGVFVCNGHSDIKGDNHEILIELPKNCKWHDAKISSRSRDLEAEINIEQTKSEQVRLSFGQFRMKEFITIKGLIECNNKSILDNLYNFHNQISFFHRIEDTEKVNTDVIDHRQTRLRLHLIRQLPFLLLLVLSIFMIFDGSDSSSLIYQDKETKNSYNVSVSKKGQVVLRDRCSIWSYYLESDQVISLKEFKEKYVVIAQYEKYGLPFLKDVIGFVIMDIFVICFICSQNRRYFRDRNRLRLYVGEK